LFFLGKSYVSKLLSINLSGKKTFFGRSAADFGIGNMVAFVAQFGCGTGLGAVLVDSTAIRSRNVRRTSELYVLKRQKFGGSLRMSYSVAQSSATAKELLMKASSVASKNVSGLFESVAELYGIGSTLAVEYSKTGLDALYQRADFLFRLRESAIQALVVAKDLALRLSAYIQTKGSVVLEKVLAFYNQLTSKLSIKIAALQQQLSPLISQLYSQLSVYASQATAKLSEISAMILQTATPIYNSISSEAAVLFGVFNTKCSQLYTQLGEYLTQFRLFAEPYLAPTVELASRWIVETEAVVRVWLESKGISVTPKEILIILGCITATFLIVSLLKSSGSESTTEAMPTDVYLEEEPVPTPSEIFERGFYSTGIAKPWVQIFNELEPTSAPAPKSARQPVVAKDSPVEEIVKEVVDEKEEVSVSVPEFVSGPPKIPIKFARLGKGTQMTSKYHYGTDNPSAAASQQMNAVGIGSPMQLKNYISVSDNEKAYTFMREKELEKLRKAEEAQAEHRRWMRRQMERIAEERKRKLEEEIRKQNEIQAEIIRLQQAQEILDRELEEARLKREAEEAAAKLVEAAEEQEMLKETSEEALGDPALKEAVTEAEVAVVEEPVSEQKEADIEAVSETNEAVTSSSEAPRSKFSLLNLFSSNGKKESTTSDESDTTQNEQLSPKFSADDSSIPFTMSDIAKK